MRCVHEILSAIMIIVERKQNKGFGKTPYRKQQAHFPSHLVSQFTLLASTKKGNKPDFHGAMGGAEAKELYDYFFSAVQDGYSSAKVKDGVFQAMMEVGLINDGPVCVVLLQLDLFSLNRVR